MTVRAQSLVLTLSLAAFAAGPAVAQSASLRYSLPSPTAASVTEVGEVPVGLYTGRPDIALPLFEVQGRTLSTPVGLRYNAGGVHVEEIGLGWSLEAGGTITRTVRGIADEETHGYYNTGHRLWDGTNWSNSPPAGYLQDVKAEIADALPDQFAFNFNGRAGSFVLGPVNATAPHNAIATVPTSTLSITPTISGGKITSWTVRDDQGTVYTFDAVETTTDYSVTSTGTIPAKYGVAVNTAWHLTKIQSASGADEITFAYASYLARHDLRTYQEKNDYRVQCAGSGIVNPDTPSQSSLSTPSPGPRARTANSVLPADSTVQTPLSAADTTWTPVADPSGKPVPQGGDTSFSGGNFCAPDVLEVYNRYEVRAQRLTTITAAVHTVAFATTLRTDARAIGAATTTSGSPASGAQQEPKLDRITVSTQGSGTTPAATRRFDFAYGVFPGDARLQLQNVQEQDGAGSLKLPPTNFTYDGQALPARASYAIDHWGYYNGRTANATSIPQMFIGPYGHPGTNPNTVLPGADRSPSATHVSAGTLTQITHPTGGTTAFQWETHDYSAVADDPGAALVVDGPTLNAGISSAANQGLKTTTFVVGGVAPTVVSVSVILDPAGCTTINPPCPSVELTGPNGLYASYPQTGSYRIGLSPGTYTLRATTQGFSSSAPDYASISASWKNQLSVLQQTTGGLRISRVTTTDGLGTTTVRRYLYNYEDNGTHSYGVLVRSPKYHFSYNSGTCAFFSRSSVAALPSESGSPVSYRTVVVWDGVNGEFGKTRHDFRAPDAYPDLDVASVWPHGSSTSRAYMRGQETATFEQSSTGLVQRLTARAFRFRDQDAGVGEPTTTRRYRALDVVMLPSFQLSSGTCNATTLYFPNSYAVVSAWAHPETETVTQYSESGSGGVATTRTYTYDDPTHLRPTRVSETNSDGTVRTTDTRYAVTQYPLMRAQNVYDAVYSTTVSRGTADAEQKTWTEWASATAGSPARTVWRPSAEWVWRGDGTANPTVAPATPSTSTADKVITYSAYDTYGRPTSALDARGYTVTFGFSTFAGTAYPTTITRVNPSNASLNLTRTYTYDTSGRIATETDEGGVLTTYGYDTLSRLTSVRQGTTSGALAAAYAYAYSRTTAASTFNPSSPNSVTTTLYRSPTGPTDATQRVTSVAYLDGLGRPAQSHTSGSDPGTWDVTGTRYDARGRPDRQYRPFARTTTGFLTTLEATVQSWYNSYLGGSGARPWTETTYTPDPLSRVKRVTAPSGGAAPQNAHTTSVYTTNTSTKYLGLEVTDPTGRLTRSWADLFGNVRQTVAGAHNTSEAATTSATVDVLGNVTQTTDPRSLASSTTYDPRSRPTQRVTPDAGTTKFKYDRAGNLRFSQDARQAAAGRALFTTYDHAGRPLVTGEGTATWASLDPDGSNAVETATANWLVVRAYDAKPATTAVPWSYFSTQVGAPTLAGSKGQLVAVASLSDAVWQLELYSYDARGRVGTRYVHTRSGSSNTAVNTALDTRVVYTYDYQGNPLTRQTSVGAGFATSFWHWFDYDGGGRPWKTFASLTNAKPGTADATWTYTPWGAPKAETFAGGTATPRTYTVHGWLASIGSTGSAAHPFSQALAYGPSGLVTSSEWYNKALATPRARYVMTDTPISAPTTSSYDALGRLRRADFSPYSGSWQTTTAGDLAMGYDKSGNVLSLQRYREAGTVVDNLTYSYPSTSNRLSAVADAVAATAEAWDVEAGPLTYDANGNVLTAPAPYSIKSSSYDWRNLPTRVTSQGTTTGYRYDASGRRYAEFYVSSTGVGLMTTTSSEHAVLDGGAVAASVSGTTGAVSYWAVTAPSGAVVGRTAAATGTGRRYFHTDHLGSVRTTASEAGAAVEGRDYEPFGAEVAWRRTAAAGPREGYTGHERDGETGLVYAGARYLMTELGRWTSVDPLEAEFPSDSPYNYALNDPYGYNDPTGMASCDITLCGRNGSSVTVRTDLIDIEVDVSRLPGTDFRGNHVLEGEGVLFAALDIAGTIDPSPTIDLITAGLYAGRGEIGNTLISGAGVVPLAGDAFKLFRAGKHIDTITDAIGSYRSLRRAGLQDAHHVVQDAAVRNLPGYSRNAAPAVQLPGPSTRVGSPHYNATQAQRRTGGGTYGAERRVSYRALREAGMSPQQARAAVERSDEYFRSIGVTRSTTTRIPGNRRR